MAKADIKALRERYNALREARQPFVAEWRNLRDYIAPDCGQFDVSEIRPDDRWEKILDPSASDAADVLAAGMLGGMTSPARPWFQLSTSSPELDEQVEIKQWLSEVTTMMQMIFARSNLYESLHSLYYELGVFGTGCIVVEPSAEKIVQFHLLTIGEYYIATNHEGRVDTLYREVFMTASQMVDKFGYDKVSKTVQKAYDGNRRQQGFKVIHAIEPRNDRDIDKIDQENMPWRSVYFEHSVNEPGKGLLLEEGFEHFPGLCPRWKVRGRNVYGFGPGSKALPTVRSLQGETLDKSYGVGYQTRPPLMVPAYLQDQGADWAPGGIVYVNSPSAEKQVTQAINANFNLEHVRADIADGRSQINEFFFKDLFLMIAGTQRYGRTAFEVEKLEKEKMMLLGPVLESLHTDLLNPLIDVTFDIMVANGLVPPAPEMLQGMDLSVSYVSILAQAQKAVGVDATDRFINTLGAINQAFPEAHASDILDTDKLSRKYADQLGVDPEILRTDEQVQGVREERVALQQSQMQMAQAQQMASVAKDMSQVQQDSGTDMLSQLQGY